MSKREQTDWKQVTLEVFGTEDADSVREQIQESCDAYFRSQNTFGRFLRSLRRQNGLSLNEMATQAEVPPVRWADWEGDMHLPSFPMICEVLDRLEYGPEEKARMKELLAEAPVQFLRVLSNYCLEKCAAAGPQSLDVTGLWRGIPSKSRSMLLAWATKAGRRFPEELIEVIQELNGDEARRESWLLEILEETR